jgi:hypothetical protein
MANKQINIGTPTQSAAADSLQAAFTKINTNFDAVDTFIATPAKATNVLYAQAGTGAVNKMIDAKLKGLYVLPEEYGTVGAGNDTAAVQAAANTGRRVLLLEKTYQITSVTLPKESQGISGFGDTSVIQGGVGGDATSHILSIIGADYVNRAWNSVFDNFKITTSVNRTGGSAFLLRNTSNVTLNNVRVGDLKDLYTGAATNKFLYNGVTWIDYYHARMYGCDMAGFNNDGVTIAGQDIGGGEMFWEGAQVIQAGRAGFHCAGMAGGVKLLSGGCSLSRIGLLVSLEIGSTVNPQIFVGSNFSLDTCIDYGALFQPNATYVFIADTLWCRANGKNALGAAIAGAQGKGIVVAPGQRNDALFHIAQMTCNENIGNGAEFTGGNVICGGEASFNGGNGLVLGGDLTMFKGTGITTRYNTSYGHYVDPAIVSAAKANNKTLHLIGSTSFANGAGESTGLTGTAAGRYRVDSSMGIPNS